MSDMVTAQGTIIAINDYDDSLSIIISAVIAHVPPYPKPIGFLISDTKS